MISSGTMTTFCVLCFRFDVTGIVDSSTSEGEKVRLSELLIWRGSALGAVLRERVAGMTERGKLACNCNYPF